LGFLDFLSDLDASDRIAIVAAVVALISAIAAVRANGIARAANKLAADANSISGESNSIARGANKISEQARDLAARSVELEEAAHADRDRERTARAVLTAETKVESVVARTIAAMPDPLISPEAYTHAHTKIAAWFSVNAANADPDAATAEEVAEATAARGPGRETHLSLCRPRRPG
jgi:hypothetical protein